MDLTPESYTTSSPRFSSTFRPNSNMCATTYPTPPQSHPQTEVLSAQSPALAGLGIANCGVDSPNAQLALCARYQPLMQQSQCWPHNSPSTSTSFSNPSPHLNPFSGLGFYDDLDTIPTKGNSPFVVPSGFTNTPNGLTFPNHSQHQQQSRIGNPALQSAPILDNYDLSAPPAQTTRPQQRISKYSSTNGSRALPVNHNISKRPFSHEDGLLSQRPASSVSSEFNNRMASDMLLELNPNVERQGSQSRAQRSPLRSSNFNGPTVEGSRSAPVHDQRVKKQPQKRKSTMASKTYKCDECGEKFTRNSNCKSHMKIHDPNRKYPHKCNLDQCAKKFSRKTDLVRHVDSVHRKLRKFGCDQCGHFFARQDTLRRHCEDGCRRRQRLSQRGDSTVPASVGTVETYQPGDVQYREPRPTYREVDAASQPELRSAYVGPSFPHHSSGVYSHYSAC